MGEIPKELLVD